MALYGLIGFPISHSLSYKINNAVLNKFEDHYVVFETKPEDLFSTVMGLKALSKGFNVTIPYKKSIILYLDRLSEDAGKIGAVNAVKVENKTATGYNTDYLSMVNLMDGRKVETAMIFGAGGGARAAAFALFKLGCLRFFIYNRTKENGLSLKSKIESWGAEAEVTEEPKSADAFVNATPMGMYSRDDVLVDFYLRGSYKVVVDLPYDVRVWGGISFLNALISGKGSVMAVKIPLEVEIRSSNEWNCDDVAKEIFRASELDGPYSVLTLSKIPIGVGLKSSSAYTVALALGAQALKGHVDPEKAVRVSAEVSKEKGISYTGAYDDAYAAVYGGIVISDNRTGFLLTRREAPRRWLVTIGLKEGIKKTVNQKALSSFGELGSVVLDHLKKEKYYFASILNSLIVASANGYPTDPIVKAAKAGLIAGISGNGPAYFAISEGLNYKFKDMKNVFTSPANEKYSIEVLSDYE